MLYAYAEATVPKITLALRKEYGGAVMAMYCVGMGVDQMFPWPISPQLVVLDTATAMDLIYLKEIKEAENSEAFRQEKEETGANKAAWKYPPVKAWGPWR